MTPSTPPRSLVALTAAPVQDPAAWAGAVALGAGGVAIINVYPIADAPDLHRGIARIVAGGGAPLGHVNLGYATRPVTDILADITEWTRIGVTGLFLDHAPSGPYQIGPVVQAVRHGQRHGLDTMVLNAGVPVDPLYRQLDVTVCTFEGSWTEYLTWSGAGSKAGDGHLVFGVPSHEVAVARGLIAARGAGLCLVSARNAVFPSQRQPGEAEASRDDALWTSGATRQ